MAEVKWIKLETEIFDNSKIKFIRSLPQGNDILLFWIMLLVKAGKCNAGGYIFITENVPYTEEAFANEFDIPLNTIKLAIGTFEKLNMLNSDGRGLCITGWSEHQSEARLQAIREYNKLAKRKSREKNKQLEAPKKQNVNDNVNDGQGKSQTCHDTDIDIDKDIDKEDIYNNAINLCKYFSSVKVGQSITQHISQLQIFIGDYGYDWCLEALKKTIEKINKFSPNYMETILKDWKLNGKPEPKNKVEEKQTTNSSAYNAFDFSFMEGGNDNGKGNDTSTTQS